MWLANIKKISVAWHRVEKYIGACARPENLDLK
jgi:hypothetical protein